MIVIVVIRFLLGRSQLWELRILPEMFSKNQAELADRRKTYKLGTSWGGGVTLSFTVCALLFLIYLPPA